MTTPRENTGRSPGALNTTAVATLLVLSATLAGCATKPQPLYAWQNYQPQVYQYLKGSPSDPQQQITVLEQDFEKTKAQGGKTPPGFHAHIGMLYASAGKGDQALQEFQTEKALFPESAAYMDMLLAKAKPSTARTNPKEQTP